MGKYLKKNVTGSRYFGNTITVTDPCYDRDVWCRIDGLEIREGDYDCIYWTKSKDNRVMCCGIYLNGFVPPKDSFEEIGTIGVDAGLAGFFENKPDYNDDEWLELVHNFYDTEDKNSMISDCGFFTSTGYGDGCYGVGVYTSPASGKVEAVEIWF